MELKDLTDEQRESMKVKHYTLHIPITASKEQINFIEGMARSVLNNEPFTVIHEKAMQFLLRLAYSYRNILTEFDEQDRWKDEDDNSLEKISREFKPILDWIVETYKLNVDKFVRD
jgi:hypothetical protein